MSMTDWNDLHVAAGIDEVRRQFNAALQSANDEAQRQPVVDCLADDEAPAELFAPPQAALGANDWRYALQCNKAGQIKPMVSNIGIILLRDEHFADALGY